MKSVLVTGGYGFIGSHVVDLLVEKNYHVTVTDNLSTGKLQNLMHLDVYNTMKYSMRHTPVYDVNKKLSIYINEFDSINVLSDIQNQKFDYVLHLAAKASVPYSVDKPVETNNVNVTKTLRLLDACKVGKVKKVVFSSSSAVYGDCSTFPTKESCVKNPMSPYALQKSIIEDYCKLYYNLYGLETVCLRYFNVFGPRQAGSGPYANVVSSWCENALKNNKIRLDGDGNVSRDFVFVKDVANANLLAMESNIKQECINIGSGTSMKIKDVLAVFKNHFDVQVINAPSRLGDPLCTLADIELAKELLGFEPTKVTADVFSEIFHWYKENVV